MPTPAALKLSSVNVFRSCKEFEMTKLVNARELAQLLKVTPATIHAWHRRGWIPCLRAGRRPVLFDVEAVEKALRDRAERSEVRHVK